MSNVQKITDFTAMAAHAPQPENHPEHLEIELHPAWHGQFDMGTANQILEHKRPFSYIITQTGPNAYVLSHVRAEDNMVTHTPFSQGNGTWNYRNGDSNKCPTLANLISKAMHCGPEDGHPLSPMPKNAAKV